MAYSCDHCGTSFTAKSNLCIHLKSAKYCLQKRGLILKNECEGCGKCFSRKSHLIRHEGFCVVHTSFPKKFRELLDMKDSENTVMRASLDEKDAEIQVLLDELETSRSRIEELEEDAKTLALVAAETKGQIKVYRERPGTVNNFVNSKLLQVKCDSIRPFTQKTVKEDIKAGKYTFEKFIQGERGLIDFISDIIIKDDQRSYVSTDSSRQKFHRLLASREWKEDNGALFLNSVLDELKETATNHYQKIVKMMTDPNGDRELADILMAKTKLMAFGIIDPKSKDREVTFTKIRNEIKLLASI